MALTFQIEVDDKGSAKVKNFKKQVGESGKASETASKSLKLFAGGIAAGGAAAVGTTAALFAMSKSFAESQDKITKMGRELGVSTEFLSAMEFSAKLAGTSLSVVDKGLAKLSKQALDAQNGMKTSIDAFNDLGVSVKNTDGTFKESNELLFEISDRFKEMPDGVMKTARAQEIFGKSGKQMINLLNQGSEALKEQAKEAESLGIVFDSATGEKAEVFNDTLLRLQETFRGFFMEVSNDLIPIFSEGMGQLQEDFINAKPTIIEFAKDGTEIIRKMLPVMGELVSLTSKVVSGLNNFNKIDFEDVGADLESGLSEKFKNSLKEQKKIESSAAEMAKKNEQRQRKLDKLNQQRELKRRKAAQQRQEATDRNAKKRVEEEQKAQQKVLEDLRSGQDAYEEIQKKKADSEEEARQKRLEKAKEVNLQINLLLMESTEQEITLAKKAHEERVALGANEFQSRVLMEKQLTEIAAQEEDARLQKRMQTMQQVSEGFSLASQALSNINQTEQNLITERFEKRREEIENTFQAELEGAEGNAEAQEQITAQRDEKLRQLELKKQKSLEKAQKKTAALRKSVAIGEAISNGALAVTRAWAEGGPFAGPILAGLAAAVTATQVGLIASQKFFEGGVIKGKDSLISTNENGTESILNARATSAVGEDALNDFNSGRTQDALDRIQSSLGGNSSKGVSINISGGVVDRRFAENELVPMIEKAMRNR